MDAFDVTRPRAWRLLGASALLLACYAAMIALSRLIADPAIPLDNRILSPFLLLAMTAMATALACWWRGARFPAARVAVAVALIGWWVAGASVARDDTRYALDYGSDFAGEQWRRSPLLDWARTNGARHPLYTNWPAAVYFHLHRPSRSLPDDTGALTALADTLRRRDGRVLVFDVGGMEYVSAKVLSGLRGLRIVARLDDGVVLAPTP